MYKDVIIVANRSPIDYKRPIEEETPKLSMGGLVTGMSGLLKEGDCTWVCMSGGKYDFEECDEDHRILYDDGNFKFTMKKVFLPREHEKRHYDDFCNGFLWPVFHITDPYITYSRSFPSNLSFSHHDYAHYEMANTTFANAAIQEFESNPRPVWIQDYHFLIMPNKIKNMLVRYGYEKPRIAQFMHIPFPSNDATRFLEDMPEWVSWEKSGIVVKPREDILRGMLGNSLLGFHIPKYADNFIETVDYALPGARIGENGPYRTVTVDGHTTFVRDFPIGIDFESVQKCVSLKNEIGYKTPDLDLNELIKKRKAAGIPVFCGIERADYTKGILERFSILEGMLRKGEKLQYIGFSTSSRVNSPGYEDLNWMISKEVNRINSRYRRDLGFDPVVQRKKGIYQPDNMLLLRDADAVMVTSLEDGMNLVIPEAIASKSYLEPQDRGSVIIGKCGASHVLRDFGEADGLVRINPAGTRKSVKKILSTYRNNVSDRLITAVRDRMDVNKWREANMEALYEVTE